MYAICFNNQEINGKELLELVDKKTGNYCHCTHGTIITTYNGTAKELFDLIKDFVYQYKNANVLVLQVDPNESSGWLPRHMWNWLKDEQEDMRRMNNMKLLVVKS